MLGRIAKWSALALLGVLLLAGAGLLAFRAVRQHRITVSTRIAVPPGVDLLEKVKLGGVAQSIQIRGSDRSLPLLLILHGGPGLPDMPYAYVNAGLEKAFVVVEWDQRGTGKSFDARIRADSMRIEQLVNDAHQLVVLLCARFHQKQIFLLGHSSGSVIGALLAARNPELFRAYVGISQVANLQESEKLLYAFAVRAAASSHDQEASGELSAIGPPPFSTTNQLQVSQKWVNHFAPDRFGALSFERWRLAFFSPAYSLFDLVRVVRGANFSFASLVRELFALDLFRAVPRLNVPVYFFVGRDDHVVTAQVQERYFRELTAPRGKQLVWFEKSAHWPQLEEPAKFQQEMIEHVLAENRPRDNGLSPSE